MNNKKISFIICYNDDYYMRECQTYLNELLVPDGYQVEILGVTEAKSMTAGYNEGMRQSNAKYKVYLHQDVFITNKNFILEILELFHSDEEIGMIGLVGTPYMVRSGAMWQGIRFGGFYKLKEQIEKGNVHRFYGIQNGYMEMEAIDGLLMATQYDLPWREALFQKWDFYDVSQSFEFIKAGYKVVVPGQDPEWYIHDCGAINLTFYNEEREKFLIHYPEYMKGREEEGWEEYLEQVRKRIRKGYHGDEKEREYLLSLVDYIEKEEKH